MTELKKEGIQIKANPEKETLIGTVLDSRYEVLELVGKGAMGSLYRGKHLALDRPVAIKFLHAHLANDEKHMERFAREAKMAATLSHGNIAHVYDVGNSAEGSPYLVMDFLDGRSLMVTVDELGALPARRALPLLQQVAQGLAYAHSKGLLHRDLKLSNVMIVNDGVAETAKIIDFGIAKSISEEEATRLTQTGEVFGSPLYMSPEQCQGQQLDVRSDIYSFGCVMYEVLTGVPPIKGDSLVSTIYKHINEQPKPFAEVAPGAHIPKEVEDVVFRCLKKDREQRYQNAAELVDIMQKVWCPVKGIADGVPPTPAAAAAAPSAAPVSAYEPYQPTKPASNTGLIIALAIPIIGSMAMIPFLMNQKPPLPPATSEASKVAAPTGPVVLPDGRPVVAEFVVDGAKRQFTKDDYLGDDGPVVWKNPAAASQPVDVLFAYTHQASDHPRSFEDKYEIVGNVNVHVPNRGKPVTLVLGAYGPINWHVKIDPGVTLQKVIASGYRQQKVDAPAGVPVIESSSSLAPNYADRPSKPFEPFSDLSNISKGEDPAQNSYFQATRETIKRLADGNDLTEARITSQTHQVDF